MELDFAAATCQSSEDPNVLANEIASIEAEQSRLFQRKLVLLRTLNSFVPIHRLPDDCLSMIFLSAHNMEKDMIVYHETWTVERWYDRLPFAVSHACTRWRAVALSTVRLWSRPSLAIRLPRRLSHQTKNYVQGLEDRLNKMMESPFDLSVSCGLSSYVREALNFERSAYNRCTLDRTIRSEMQVISPYLLRCRSLAIFSDPKEEWKYEILCRRFLISMPLLEELSVEIDCAEPAVQVIIPLPVVNRCFNKLHLRNVQARNLSRTVLSTLTTLRAEGAIVTLRESDTEPDDDELERMRDSWPQSGNVLFDGGVYEMPLDMIQEAKCLRTLDLKTVYLGIPDQAKDAELTYLETLILALGYDVYGEEQDLHQSGLECTIAFFRLISMPALRSCTISGQHMHGEDAVDSLLDGVAEAALPLLELSLKEINFSGPEILTRLLSVLPGLHTLSFDQTPWKRRTAQILRAKPTGTLVPKLRTLHIYNTEDMATAPREYLPGELRKVLRSRFESNSVGKIEHFKFRGDSHYMTQKTWRELKRWAGKASVYYEDEDVYWDDGHSDWWSDDDSSDEPEPAAALGPPE